MRRHPSLSGNPRKYTKKMKPPDNIYKNLEINRMNEKKKR